MEILFAPWLPIALFLLGVYLVVKARGTGLKIAGTVLVLIGGLLLALQIWIYFKHYNR